MAVVLIRVDQRLLHGQVVEGWVPHLKVDTVVVADDAIANDPILNVAMCAACPAKVKLHVMRVNDAALAAGRGTLPGKRTLVLVATVNALDTIWKSGFRAEQVNVGNVPIAPGRARVTSSVALSKDEVQALDQIAASGVPVEARAVPREKAVDLQGMHQAVERTP